MPLFKNFKILLFYKIESQACLGGLRYTQILMYVHLNNQTKLFLQLLPNTIKNCEEFSLKKQVLHNTFTKKFVMRHKNSQSSEIFDKKDQSF